MKYYFLTHSIMTKKAGLLTAVATATALSMSPVSANTNNQTEQQKIEQKEIGKKVEQVTCATKLACEALSHSIQTQINELEKKGLENLSDEEFVKYSELSDELIAIKDSSVEIEQKETEQNADLIASKNETILRKEKLKSAYHEVNSNLLSIKGSL